MIIERQTIRQAIEDFYRREGSDHDYGFVITVVAHSFVAGSENYEDDFADIQPQVREVLADIALAAFRGPK